MTRVIPEAHDALQTIVARHGTRNRLRARARKRGGGRRVLLVTAGVLVLAGSAAAATGGVSVFDREPTSEDAPDQAETLYTNLEKMIRANIDERSSRLLFKNAYKAIYVTRTDTGTCLHTVRVYAGIGTNCNSDEFVSGGIPGDTYGFVPSDVEQVTFTLTDGTTETQAIKGNLWHAPPEARSATVRLRPGDVKTVNFAPLSVLGPDRKICPDGMSIRKDADCANKETW